MNTSSHQMDMNSDEDDFLEHEELNWPDEDTSPTTTREIHGFYSYGIAAEVFAVVGVGAFLPVTLEQLARENGVLYSDRNTPCISPTKALLIRATDGPRDPDQCVISPFGIEVTTASFAMYTFSVAVLCQALTLVSVSAFADHGNNRKRLLLAFGVIGAIASMSFMFVVPAIYLVGSLLVVIGVTCLGSSFTILNSWLPLLASHHPDTKLATKNEGTFAEDVARHAAELQLSGRISSNAVGLGYAAAILVQVLGIAILSAAKAFFADSVSSTLPLRLILLLAGFWWLIFMVPTAMWLRKRPGPPLSNTRLSLKQNRFAISWEYIRYAWTALFGTIQIAFQLKQMVIFLAAWFVLSDAQASVSGTAVLFARTELKIGTIGIAMLSITVMVSGVAGATLIPFLATRWNWSTPQTIVSCLVLLECIPLYGLLGYLPFIQSWGVLGLQKWWEIYPCAAVFGVVMAGLSSFCRACFGQLIPPGHEAAFFALFAITDKGSSAIGPAVIGRIVDATGHIRPAFWFLAVIVAIPMPLVWKTDIEQGRQDAIRMSKQLRSKQQVSTQMQDLAAREEAERLMGVGEG